MEINSLRPDLAFLLPSRTAPSYLRCPSVSKTKNWFIPTNNIEFDHKTSSVSDSSVTQQRKKNLAKSGVKTVKVQEKAELERRKKKGGRSSLEPSIKGRLETLTNGSTTKGQNATFDMPLKASQRAHDVIKCGVSSADPNLKGSVCNNSINAMTTKKVK